MKRTLSLFLLLAVTWGSLAGCGSSNAVSAQELTAQPTPLSQQEMAVQGPNLPAVYAAVSDFGLSLLQEARRETEGDTLISPLSVVLALSMAANGADGDTLEQFETVLAAGADLAALNAACQTLSERYENLGGSTECSIANSLWIDPDGMLREDFIGLCRGILDAQVFSQELSDPSVVPAVNGWVSDHTKKMIPAILSEPFSGNTAALLANALYLKNTWETEFDPNDTYLRGFYHQEDGKESMDFLNAFSTSFPYLQGKDAQGVVLPYDDGQLAFFALMPHLYPDSPEFGAWLDSLDGSSFAQLLESRTDTEFLTLALPKFEAEWSGQLQNTLSSMGLDLAFDNTGLADFSLLGDNPNGYYLSQVIHAAKIEVNEKGTEAAAATVVPAESGSAAPPESGITLIFDRPFLYGIADLETGVPLFLGTFE